MVSNVTAGHDIPTIEAAGHDPAELGELERSVLQLLWQHGTLSAEQVREELDQQDRSLKDSTVRTVLRRLEEKGYLTHVTDNRTFLYSPAEPAPMVAGRAVKRILEWFCEGSVEQLLVGMVDSSVLDGKELKRLAERIATAQSQAAKKSAQGSGQGKE
jgi:BlaI family penicillinase repressor